MVNGPSGAYTQAYLDILAQYGAKATFFSLAQNAEEYPDLCRAVVEAGHQLGTHTYDHKDLLTLTHEELVQNEIVKSLDVFERIAGVRPTSLRPPYGNLYGRQFTWLLDQICYSAYWDVDSEDWKVAGQGQAGVDHIVAQCTANLTDTSYNGAIVLMHDGGGNRDCDVAALPQIIEAYQALGYELVTMDELLRADPTIPEWLTSGRPGAPEGYTVPDLSAYA